MCSSACVFVCKSQLLIYRQTNHTIVKLNGIRSDTFVSEYESNDCRSLYGGFQNEKQFVCKVSLRNVVSCLWTGKSAGEKRKKPEYFL